MERLAIERTRFHGRVESLTREIYDPGDGAAILRYDPSRSRVVLVGYFRLRAFLRRCHESLIEVCAGKPEGEDAESRISKETEKKAGFCAASAQSLRSLHEPWKFC
ncbi:MAG: hypothetical protein M3178_17255 [Pseudomonadota bacterium]|nr:hypothetical protein [Pseudomonadota bacterium]